MTSFEGANQCLHIHTWIEEQVRCYPGAIALIQDNQHYSYHTINTQANQLARYLQKLGVGSGTLVGICTERSPWMVIAVLAVLKAGGAYVPIDPDYPKERIAVMIDDAQVPVLVAGSPTITQLFNTFTHVVCLETDWDTIVQEPCHNLELALSFDQLAYVIYTSGSTGRPKGVMIEHRTLVNFIRSAGSAYAFTPQDRVLQFASISFDISVEEIFGTLTHGATLVLRSQEMLRSTSAFLRACQDWKITVIDLPTAFWHKICAELPYSQFPDALRLVIIGGERAVPQWLNFWKNHAPAHVRLVNTYGPTEATVVTTLCDLAGPNAVSLNDSRTLPIGKPLNNVQAYILDENFSLVAEGESGELYIAGGGLARGYLHRADLTDKSYFSKRINGESVRVYKTGDRVRRRKDGHIEFLGRADSQEKIRGFRVELSEIESVIEQHPSVKQSIVIAREDSPGNKRLAAYIVLDKQARAAKTLPQLISGAVPNLRSHLQRKLPGYMIPSSFVLLDGLPLSANGKVDRRALPIPNIERPCIEDSYTAPRTPLEEDLVEAFSTVLSIVGIGVNDDFFELGGNSLQTMELISFIEKNYQVDIRLKDFMAIPTVAGVATLTQQNRADEKTPGGYMSLQQMQAEVGASQNDPIQILSDRSTEKDIFMTGATGFLGNFLLQELLQQTSSKVYCLVRASSLLEAQQKIFAALKKYCSSTEIPYHRIVPVVGNLMHPNLGMEAVQFRAIAHLVGSIYHCGANVNMFYPYTALKSVNVRGTREIIKLAATGPVKVLHHVSTLDVLESLARMGQDTFYENDNIAQGEGILGGYAQSKWIAEQLVYQASVQGLPVCIYRPGMVTGHSKQGQSNTNDVLCRFIKSLIQLQSAPELALSVDMTPVDYVSKAIARISLQSVSTAKCQVFHIVNPTSIALNEIVTTLAANGYDIKTIDEQTWLKRLCSEPTALSALAAFTASATEEEQRIYLELWLGGRYIFDCSSTTEQLENQEIACPPADKTLLSTYLRYFNQQGFIETTAALPKSSRG